MMNKFISLFLSVVMVALCSFGSAQEQIEGYDLDLDSVLLASFFDYEEPSAGSGGLAAYRDKLTARPDSTEYLFFEPGRVTLNSDRSATAALEKLESGAVREISGYRIGVFFSNRANGRAEANAVVEKCAELYSDIETSMVYDNPYFKVHAGFATTNEEAVMLLSRLQKSFPKAYIIREKMTPKDMIIENKIY